MGADELLPIIIFICLHCTVEDLPLRIALMKSSLRDGYDVRKVMKYCMVG